MYNSTLWPSFNFLELTESCRQNPSQIRFSGIRTRLAQLLHFSRHRTTNQISNSSCESEIVALSEAAKEVIYLRKFVRGLVPSLPDGPTVLSTDNKGARDLSYNPEHRDKSKHIARRHGVVHAWVGQIVTFFAYRPPSAPLGSLTPTQPGRVTDPTRGCPGPTWEAAQGMLYNN